MNYVYVAERRNGKMLPLVDTPGRFWSDVDKTGSCWLWTAGVSPSGYGTIWWDRRHTVASRVSWELTNGPIPLGLLVLHRCDVPLCVNPDHLFLGTQRDNVLDSMAKRRHLHGEKQPDAKMTEATVIELRRMWANGAKSRDLAVHFGISAGNVRDIAIGRKWKHVPGAMRKRPSARRAKS